VKEAHFESGEGMRQEGSPWKTDREFRDTMFANAPFADGDSLVAEKGAWKKNNSKKRTQKQSCQIKGQGESKSF
jgi:hypothetical protein